MVKIGGLKNVSYVLEFLLFEVVAQSDYVICKLVDRNSFISLLQMQRARVTLNSHDFVLDLLEVLTEESRA